MKEILKNNKGITMLPLIITIVVLIILASVTIKVVNNDGVTSKAQESKEKTKISIIDKDIKKDILKKQNEPGGLTEEKLNAILSNYGTVTQEGEEKILVTTEDYRIPVTIYYNSYLTSSKEPAGISAQTIAENPTVYYDKTVTNYTCTNSAAVSEWRIFHADSSNIYLIANNYIHFDYAPVTANNYTVKQNSDYALSFNYVINDYANAESIASDNPSRKWITYLNQYGTSSNENKNIRATAYLLDTSLWENFKMQGKADYVIGAPTLELFKSSYNNLYNTEETIDLQILENGYQVKWSTDTSYANYINGLNTSNTLYALTSNSISKMWVASPSGNAAGMLWYTDESSSSTPLKGNGTYYLNGCGLRPVVCLNSSVLLEEQADGTYKIL